MKNYQFILFIFISVLIFNNAQEDPRNHECKHDLQANLRAARSQDKTVPTAPSARTGKNPQPFRMTYEFTSAFTTALGNTATSVANLKFMNQSLVILQRYFSNLLKVFYEGPNATTIANNTWKGGNTCGGFALNVSKYSTPLGVKNSDLHVFIHTSNEITGFFGQACSWQDTGSTHPDRSNFGIIYIPQSKLTDMSSQLLPSAIQSTVYNTILHQFFHILGLSKSEYQWWHKSDTEYYTQEQLYAILDNFPYEENQVEITQHVFLKTPALQRASFKQYEGKLDPQADDELRFMQDKTDANLRDLLGVALENNQENTYVGDDPYQLLVSSHWEQTTTYGEIMNAAGFGNQWFTPVVSHFTLAALKDTGYYAFVNLEMSELLVFGIGKGLDFQFTACNSDFYWFSEFDENGNELPAVFHEIEFPYDDSDFGCDFYGTGFAQTVQTIYSDDYCYLRLPSDQYGNCKRDDATSFDASSKPWQRAFTFDSRGPNSRCFISDFGIRINNLPEDPIEGPVVYRCYNTSSNLVELLGFINPNPPMLIPSPQEIEKQEYCKQNPDDENCQYQNQPFPPQNQTNVTMNGSAYQKREYKPWLKINVGQAQLFVDENTVLVDATREIHAPFFGGFLEVPPPKKFMGILSQTDCPNYCSFNGYCIRGKGCQCNVGFGGPDCLTPLLNGTTKCKALGLTFDAQSGQCIKSCYVGTFNLTGVCTACPTNCMTCANATNCTACLPGFLFENGQCVNRCSGYPISYPGPQQKCILCPQRQVPPKNCTFCYQQGDLACVGCFADSNFDTCLDPVQNLL